MTLQKTLLVVTVAAAALLPVPDAAQAQSGDPIVRFLNSIFPNAEFRSGSGGRAWDDDDDDDDDGGSGERWDDDDDDDDGSSSGRDDDDDDGGRDDNDDDD